MFRKLLIILTLMISSLPLSFIEVNATDYTTSSCDAGVYSFSVDLLTVESGAVKYTSQGCYDLNGWYSAQDKFNQLKTEGKSNIVIRYLKTDDATFQSPLKIVKADRAMAYTQNYTYTVGDVSNGVASTIGIYHNTTLTSRYTYVDNQEPLVYFDTNKSVESNSAKPSNLVAYIEINGAQGYIKTTGIDIIPFIYIENSILVPFYVKLSNNQPKTEYIRLDGRKGIFAAPTKYTVNANNEISIVIDRATTVSGTLTYSKAPSWLPQGTYYSANGINFYTDIDLKNPKMDGDQIGNFYSYYNYLNLRTKTNYTNTEIDSYLAYYDANNSKDYSISIMKNKASAFISSQNTYGMNALLVYAMGVHESDYGISAIALAKNNLFGYGANDSNPGDASYYESVEQSVDIHMGKQLRYYLDYNNNSLFYGSNYGSKGAGINTMYASDPFWNVKISGHAYRIDRYLGFKDFNAYQMAILDPAVSNKLYKESSLTNQLYTINSRAMNYPLTVKAFINDTYYVQSTNPIVNNQVVTSTTTGLVPYDFELSLAYINKNQVKLVNTPLTPIIDLNPPPPTTDSSMSYVVSFDWIESNVMSIKGFSALRNTNMALNTTTHQLIVTSLIDSSVHFEFPLELDTPIYAIQLPNGYDYTTAWFKGEIDIKSLPEGYYKFEIVTQSGPTSARFDLINTATTPISSLKTIDDFDYRFIYNNFKKMAYELIKEKGILVDNQTSPLQSRFTSFGLISNFDIQSVENRDILNIKGLSLMQHINQGVNDNMTHKLMLVSSTGQQYVYDLNTTTNNVVIKQDPNFTYTHIWFENLTIDITDLPIDNYRLYSIISNQVYVDVVELIDYAFIGNKTFDLVGSNYNLSVNNAIRKRFELSKVSD